MATAEYAIATLAAAGFAGLLLIILRSDEVRGFLLGIVRPLLVAGFQRLVALLQVTLGVGDEAIVSALANFKERSERGRFRRGNTESRLVSAPFTRISR